MDDGGSDDLVTFASFAERPIYEALAEVGKALGNAVRLRLLDALQQGERTVEDLAEFAGVPLKNTSAQLQVLRASQLVVSRRAGTRVIYSVPPAVGALIAHLEAFGQEHVARVRDEFAAHFAHHPWVNPVSVAELIGLIADGAVTVVDVRTEDEFRRGHIDGAVSIPLPELADRMTELSSHSPVVAYCEGPYCLASPRAAEQLAAAGYASMNIRGGYTAWKRHNAEA
ncbi:rhodanese-related sulfurtransferase/DNA-binding transcriptional ArsR family regulator [Microbacterium resistens]|uniref:Rhodanese-related sulfurtransferase/DNA-binding transcriptional ArsR family regulator n=1 Tax=Microbacterium resistens TaxID=156977 RepID=A0ABU1SA19_9MICO|nr:metalloregulator ArsR/SmtB family transcription factor [Microbacterium resistens]MDR6865763.1 rhodanese-related sulfurtransferase/DNA-binding transcriptional ArsR family regulator [Microbacterium resistens]